ncbi:MFS transporter [Massilia putida]|uniref:MFS transporter n=1 Tax=Massilia putida TaxID=1141883 RepID=UPI000950BCF0|nr:MFS transporter [Massilia putida]
MSTPHTGHRRITILLLMCVVVISACDKLIFSFAGPAIIRDLALTPVQFGFAGSAFFFLYSVSGIALGFLANRVKTRWILVGMSAVWATSQFIVNFASGFASLVVSRLLLGIGTGPATAITQHAGFKWVAPGERVRISSLLQISLAIGGLLSGAVLPLAILKYGWRQSYVALGVLSLVWIALWLVFGREGQVDDRAHGAAGKSATYRQLLLNRTFITVSLLGFIGYMPNVLGFSWLAVYLQQGVGLAPGTMAIYLTTLTLAVIVLSYIASWLAERALKAGTSFRKAMVVPPMLGCAVGAAAYFSMHLAHRDMRAVLALYFIGSLAINLLPVFGYAIVAHIAAPEKRGAMLAIHNGVVTSAGIVAPAAIGLLIARSGGDVSAGMELFFAVFGIVAFIGSLIGLAWIQPDGAEAKEKVYGRQRI